jgi:hypothetical protein
MMICDAPALAASRACRSMRVRPASQNVARSATPGSRDSRVALIKAASAMRAWLGRRAAE